MYMMLEGTSLRMMGFRLVGSATVATRSTPPSFWARPKELSSSAPAMNAILSLIVLLTSAGFPYRAKAPRPGERLRVDSEAPVLRHRCPPSVRLEQIESASDRFAGAAQLVGGAVQLAGQAGFDETEFRAAFELVQVQAVGQAGELRVATVAHDR